MALVRKNIGINVLEATKIRMRNIVKAGTKIYVDVSGGKDSIVMMSLVYDMVMSGELDPKRVEVVFIDEEVIYDEVVRVCNDWRKKFMLAGVKYSWFTIEHRNNNCFNALENNENFIPWDRYEEKNWSRKKPDFAISDSVYLVPRTENYQTFLMRYQTDGLALIGVRCAESINRLQYVATINSKGGVGGTGKCCPIYDWKDSDVWKYIKDKNLDFPDTYLRMYEAGTNKSQLRICNLFAIDTCKSLTFMFEVYPHLWEAVLRREPNAYLVRLYWDTEMFHRSTAKRQKLEDNSAKVDYKAKLIEVVNNPTKYFKNKHALILCNEYRNVVMKDGNKITDKQYKKLYEALMGGDTKGRTLRAVKNDIYADYLKRNNMYDSYLKK